MHLGSTFRSRWLLLALALLMKFGVTPGTEVNAGSVLTLTFIEVRTEARGHTANVLRQQASASHERQAPPGQIIVMQETSRTERFVVLERETPAGATEGWRETHPLTEGLTDDLTAPPDERLNRDFDETAAVAGAHVNARANFYVVTHVDIIPSDRSRVESALRKLAAAGRQSNGNLGFEVLQQTDRPNHFNLISAWLGESLFHAFATSAAAREFRHIVAPVLGSPYDERFFRRID